MSVFANGREMSGKAQPNQVIAGFPSVCLSPPSPPAGPIPIPYPMFTNAKKTSSGTVTVKIKKKEVGKKNASTYKKSNGNEPATRSFGMDVVSHTLSNASKHEAYSFDVKVQKAGAERFMDLTTTNHSNPATAVTINVAGVAVTIPIDLDDPCKGLSEANKETRKQLQENKLKSMQNVGNGNTTITHGLFKPSGGGPAGVVHATSRKNANKKIQGSSMGTGPKSKKELADTKAGKPLKSDVCGGDHKYDKAHPTHRPHCSHTESRIIEDLFAKTKPGADGNHGTLIMSINWQTTVPVLDDAGNPTGEREQVIDNKPCENCRDLICVAVACFKIKTCVEGEEKDWNDECADAPPEWPG